MAPEDGSAVDTDLTSCRLGTRLDFRRKHFAVAALSWDPLFLRMGAVLTIDPYEATSLDR